MPDEAVDVEGLSGFGEDQTHPWKGNLLRVRNSGEIIPCLINAGTAGCWRLQPRSRGRYGYSCQHKELLTITVLALPLPELLPEMEQ